MEKKNASAKHIRAPDDQTPASPFYRRFFFSASLSLSSGERPFLPFVSVKSESDDDDDDDENRGAEKWAGAPWAK